MSEISFPGLGIDTFHIDSTAIEFSIGSKDFSIKWYGIIICFGIICAFLYFMMRAKQVGISSDTVVDFTIVTVPTAVIGARVYFVVFFGGYDTFWQMIAIWNGGLAIYGAIIFGAAAVIIMCRIKKVKFFAFADMIGPAVMLGQAIGRWGNFCNGEAFGSETTSFIRMGLKSSWTGYDYVEVHPTFLYESLWNLIGFVLINVFYKHRRFNGEAFLWYVAWYGFGRTFIELLRTDSLYLGSVRVSSLLGLVCFVVVTPIIIYGRIKSKKLAATGYTGLVDLTDIFGLKRKARAEKTEE